MTPRRQHEQMKEAQMYNRMARAQSGTADTAIRTAFYYRDEIEGVKLFSRIGPAVLFSSLSWAGILYFVFG